MSSSIQSQTWTWDGRAWALRATSGPSSTVMVYDEHRDRVVVFQGTATWEWDGNTWTQVATSGPSSRNNHGMVYDSARRVVVLFGGVSGSTYYGDTWEWDGTAWIERVVSGPSPCASPAMAYDSDRGVTTLFGGRTSGSSYSTETWEWDGATWNRRAESGPQGGSGSVMIYDPIRRLSVFLSGTGGPTIPWEWDGVTWTSRNVPGPAIAVAATYDVPRETSLVCFGYFSSASAENNLWDWDGATWRHTTGTPRPRYGGAITYEPARDRVLLFGGASYQAEHVTDFGDGWAWDGGGWLPVSATGPPARNYHAMVYDSMRAVVVLYGGLQGASGGWGYLGDTWEWDGSAWSARSVTSPPPRAFCAAAFDSRRGVFVLFGGQRFYVLNGETWEWNGSAWSQRLVNGPSPRAGAAMCFDSHRSVCVLFGGSASSYLGDTWEWDGTAWTQRQESGPSPRADAAMAYDSVRQSVFLFGGWRPNGPSAETWEWNGTEWTQHQIPGPSARELPSNPMCFDSARGRFVLFGGWTGNGQVPNETWSLQTSCIGPTIHSQPQGQRVCAGSTVTFSVVAAGTEPFAFQWRRDGEILADEPDHISGSAAPTLTILNASVSDTGSYDCVVSNACDNATAVASTLSVCEQVGDLNCDGMVSLADLAVLLSNWGRTDSPSRADGDLNADGEIGLPDLALLLAEFGAVCP
ncbi:MAG: immunoglobulin domain-containing protein [Planctomycetes bacterium]|nr:immunoglobulin domain-containing protein [Planctomycetota bacterium]